MSSMPTPETDFLKAELSRRREAYATCKQRGLKALSSGALNDALFWLQTAGVLASHFYFGLWSDPDVERAIRKLATALGGGASANTSGERQPIKRIAHLTSNILDGGGHTEILLTWSDLIEKWGGIEQHLISSEWTDSSIHGPNNLEAYSRMVRPPRLCPTTLTPSQRVRWIYERLAEVRPDAVVLHVTPSDVSSICAALLLRDTIGSRVIYFNHADHVFSLGMSLADRVIEFRRGGARYSVWRRGIEPERIRIVPLGSRSRPQDPLSRRELGIPDDCSVSITVASYYKLIPDGHWDYGRVIHQLLSSEPSHYHLVVGHGSEAVRESIMRNFKASKPSVASRILWLGRRTDIDPLLRVSDFLIESFPLAGGTLKIDAMRAGAAVVAINNTRWPLLPYTESFGEDYPLIATSNEDVLRFSRMLIKDAGLRALQGKQLSERYQAVFSEPVLSEALKDALLSYSTRRGSSDFGTRPDYDLLYLVALGGQAIDLREVVLFTESQLNYTHTPSYSERLMQIKGRAKESLRYRLRSLLEHSPAP